MNIFYLLIGVSLFAALIFLGAFIWAVKTGQFDDSIDPEEFNLIIIDEAHHATAETYRHVLDHFGAFDPGLALRMIIRPTDPSSLILTIAVE